jgi:hypothetical protein
MAKRKSACLSDAFYPTHITFDTRRNISLVTPSVMPACDCRWIRVKSVRARGTLPAEPLAPGELVHLPSALVSQGGP